MSVQRYTRNGVVRYRARVKSHGHEIASRVFDRKADAIAWERDQTRKLHLGEWIDPRRASVHLSAIAPAWLESRGSMKRRSHEADAANWRLHIAPQFGNRPLGSITAADVSSWMGSLISSGHQPTSVGRYLATLRSILAFAVADGRISSNVAASVKAPSGGHSRRDGQHLDLAQLTALAAACVDPCGDIVMVLGLAGLRWGELAGLQVRDRITVPGHGLRLQRAVLTSGRTGEQFIDTLKNKRARTVPLVDRLLPIVERWSEGKESTDWLFHAPRGGPLHENNWKRRSGWSDAIRAVGVPSLRVHDLRHTAASIWLGAGADPKVVQRVLGHATATMTMDLYGHLIDHNLWAAASRIGGTEGAHEPRQPMLEFGLHSVNGR